jgi:hypothetical protein
VIQRGPSLELCGHEVFLGEAAPIEELLRVREILGVCRILIDRDGERRLAPKAHKGLIGGDPIEPGAHARAPLELGEAAVRVEEGLLEDVLGLLGIAQHSHGQPIDRGRIGVTSSLTPLIAQT